MPYIYYFSLFSTYGSLQEVKSLYSSDTKTFSIYNNSIVKIIDFNAWLTMETATVLIIFIASLLLGLTGYSVYTAFGPGSKELRDPFDDHED